MDPLVIHLSLAGLLVTLTRKASRLYEASARVVQDAMLDTHKSGKALAAEGAWDLPSLSRQINDSGLNWAGLFTAMRVDRAFAIAVLRRLCAALGIDVSELSGTSDAHALAARVARLEALAAGHLYATTTVDLGRAGDVGVAGAGGGRARLQGA